MSAAWLVLAAALGAQGRVLVVAPAGPDRGAPGWIGAAVEETLPRELQRAGVEALPASDPRRALDAIGVTGPLATRATFVRVAEALGARFIVFGSWDLGGGELALTLQPFDVSSAELRAPLVATGPLEGLGRLVRQQAQALAGRAPAGESPPEPAPFVALRALGEALVARDPDSRLQGLRRVLARHPGYPEAALVLARLLHDAARFAEARAVLDGLAAEPSFARERRFLEGASLLGLGRYAEADVVYADLASREPTAAVLANRAVARLRAPDGPGGASMLLRQALDRAPFAAELPFGLGWARFVEGEPETAVFWLRDAVRYLAGDARARLVLSWALRATAHVDEADEQWHAAKALDPALEPLRLADPGLRLERILPSEAALALDPARAADARAARAHVSSAEARLAAGQTEAAILELERAVRLEPAAAEPHLLLGRAHRTRGDLERALVELRAALFAREDPGLRRELADLLRAAGREAEARRVLREL